MIRAILKHRESLPEPLDIYNAEPPRGAPWPEGLPSSPSLLEFYAECDGGSIGPCSFLPLAEVADETESTADWMEQRGQDEMPPRGHWMVIGSNEYGHSLIWDADRDAMLVYDSDSDTLQDADDRSLAYDGSGPSPTGQMSLARFFERLMNPPIDSEDEATMTWAEALGHLDQLR
jgi:hypothetical protein